MKRFADEINAYISGTVDATHDDLVGVGIPREQLARATCRVRASVTGKMNDLRDAVLSLIQEEQRRVNRCLTPAVQTEMMPAYRECTQQKGTGMFGRMKIAMDKHLNVKRRVIFRRSADVLMTELAALKDKVVNTAMAEVETLKSVVEDQYAPFWKRRGRGTSSEEEEEKRQKAARAEVDDVILELEKICKRAKLPTTDIKDYLSEALFSQVRRANDETTTEEEPTEEEEGTEMEVEDEEDDDVEEEDVEEDECEDEDEEYEDDEEESLDETLEEESDSGDADEPPLPPYSDSDEDNSGFDWL